MPNARNPSTIQNALTNLTERVQDISKRQETDSKRQEEDAKTIKAQLTENTTKQYEIQSKIVSVESMLTNHKLELDAKLAETKNAITIKGKDDEIIELKAQMAQQLEIAKKQAQIELAAATTQAKTDVTIAGISVKTALLWAGLLSLLGLLGPLVFYAFKGLTKP